MSTGDRNSPGSARTTTSSTPGEAQPQGYILESAAPSAHEGADLDVPRLLKTAAIIAVILVVCLLALGGLFRFLEQIHPGRTSEASPVVALRDLPPLPRIQVDPAAQLRAVRAQEDLHLTRYAWSDASHTTAQIPIDRAMQLWLQAYAMQPAAPAAPPNAQTEIQLRQRKSTDALPHAH